MIRRDPFAPKPDPPLFAVLAAGRQRFMDTRTSLGLEPLPPGGFYLRLGRRTREPSRAHRH